MDTVGREASAARPVGDILERVPLRDESVDLVFMSMVYHHFDDPRSVAVECYRVLRRGGLGFLRTGTSERIPSYPITPFFPAAVPVMTKVLHPLAQIVETFEIVGFRAVAGVLEQEIAFSHAAYADQLRAGGDSVLAQLRPDELVRGIEALEVHAAVVDPTPVSELIDFVSLRKEA